jgi:hypothetical protein
LLKDSKLLQVHNWDDVRQARTAETGYTFIAGDDGRFLALDRALVLSELRAATIARTGQTLDPLTGGLRRGVAQQLAETRRLWSDWARAGSGILR